MSYGCFVICSIKVCRAIVGDKDAIEVHLPDPLGGERTYRAFVCKECKAKIDAPVEGSEPMTAAHP